ncbi:putative polysaccharide biosynthesis protein [Lentilactobacillus kribbianus]|uniref:putative polysaccharide biosynthesis protein n=1 Tax=Lentilactobacillus kribbianus TaxID=2729622 RepID=UPI0015581F1D|nr:polysaccharide biosynthesis protein [Lentilactobacillus kribbianus]
MSKSSIKMVQGTTILAVTGIIAKILSAVYRIPFQNLVGNVGFYVYQQVYPLYGIAMTIALNGLPVFISRLMAEHDDDAVRWRLLRSLWQWLTVLSLIFFVFLQWKANWLATMMGDPRLAPEIKVVSWLFLLSPSLAVGRGYFQGIGDMRPTAYSQVIEQLVRVTLIILVAVWAYNNHINAYVMGKWAMAAAPVAGVASLLIIGGAFYHRSIWRVQLQHKSVALRSNHLLRQIILEGGAVCLVTAVMILMQLVDSFTVTKGLVDYGFLASDAVNLKGIFDRGQTLVQFGLVIGTAMTTAVLPRLTAVHRKQELVNFHRLSKTSAHVNLVLAVAISAGLAALMPEINTVLFSSTQLDGTLATYCFSIVFATILLSENSILQSTGSYLPVIITILVGIVVKIFITQPLVAYTSTLGASISTVLSLIVMVGLLPLMARQLVPIWHAKPVRQTLMAAVIMAVVVRITSIIITELIGFSRIKAILILIVTIPLGAITFLRLINRWHVLTVREWFSIPFMKRIMKRMRRN